MSQHWVYGAIGMLLLLHAIALVRAYRESARPDRSRRDTDESKPDIECPECGAVNDDDYRYCQRCVSELPGGSSIADGTTRPRCRRTW